MNANKIIKIIVVIIICFVVSEDFFAQTKSPVFGKVINEEKEPLEYVSVVLLDPVDSTFVNYTITDRKGVFRSLEMEKDSLIIQFSSLGHAPFFKNLSSNGQPIDLGTITMMEEHNTLDEIMISAVVPISIKKDTVSYNANSFKVNPNDNLDNLLGKLPGIEISTNGKIIAQGAEITKIFIDGKAFFGGDPSLVLKNLPADAIEKVEIIDKKSNQSQLTGIDDGNKEIVINFTLKKSKKNLGFGKLSAGFGLDSRYFGNVNYNKFSSKEQFSAIGKFNNINITGSNLQEFLENADGLDDDSEGEDEDFNQNTDNLSGFLKTALTATHYGREFKEEQSLNADYSYNVSYNDGVSKSKRISLSNTNNFNFKADNIYDNAVDKHNFNVNYIDKSNKMNSLFIKIKLLSDALSTDLKREGFYFNDFDELTTTNDNISNNISDKKNGNLNLEYHQKLNNKGRSFSSVFNYNQIKTNRENKRNTFINRRINTSNPTYRELFTLRNTNLNQNLVKFNFKYTEPLSENHYLKLESYANMENEKEDVYQLRTTVTNNNEEELLAFDYINRENSYQTRFAHSYTAKTLHIYSGFEIQNLYRKFGEFESELVSKQQVYLNPIVSLQLKPNRGRKYRLTYKKIIRSPSLRQSSTIVNDLNPFSIQKGNPDLNTEKMTVFSFLGAINDFKSSLNFYAKIQFQYVEDAIVQIINIDEEFIKTRTYENNRNRKRVKSDISFGKKIKRLGLRYTIKNKFLYTSSNSIVNLQLNDLETKDFLTSLTFENYNKNNFDAKAGVIYNINDTSFSIDNSLNRTYARQQYFGMFDYDFSKKINVNTQFDYIIYTDNKFTDKIELPLLNTAVSYSFSKNKNNLLKLVFIDLLDKNLDIYRRSSGNFFEETTAESLGRYVILSYTHKLNRSKKSSVN
ncbi:MAG: outer membrane beta-barrel protein [Algibacter sp.]